MASRKPSTQARMDAVLAALRSTDKPMRCQELCDIVGGRYNQVYGALRHLERDTLVERVHADVLGNSITMPDGRVVELGPEASAVGWRPAASDSSDDLEAIWALPAADR